MSNKRDVDFISPKILIDAWPIIARTVCDIVNHSMDETMPENLKQTMLIPVPKVPKPKKADEYRPINMLPTIEKLIETVVKEQLMEFIVKNDVLTKFQSAYRERYSCETALNLVLTKWKDIQATGDVILAVFLDLKRAFETIDRERLLMKLTSIGFSASAVTWFRGYLCNRTQKTKVNGMVSDSIINGLGVPQGSVLGAILFVIYINDLPKHVLYSCINLFADDTLIYLHGKNIDELTRRMNRELDRVSQWLRLNKLKLNVSKTKSMVFRNQKQKSVINRISVDGEEIEMVHQIKYLGVVIDSNLDFKDNVDYVCKKTAKKVGVLARLANILTVNARTSIYKSIIAPHFDYCSSLLFLGDQSTFDRMQKIQNRAMRSVLQCKRLTPRITMLEALNWLSVKQRVYTNTMTFIHKLKVGKLPAYLREMVTYNSEVHGYETRGRNDFHLTVKKSNNEMNSLFHKGLSVFNALPRDLKEERELTVFKRKLKAIVRQIIQF